VVLRRDDEAGVLGLIVRAFGRIVAMMQFNMYHTIRWTSICCAASGTWPDVEAGRLG